MGKYSELRKKLKEYLEQLPLVDGRNKDRELYKIVLPEVKKRKTFVDISGIPQFEDIDSATKWVRIQKTKNSMIVGKFNIGDTPISNEELYKKLNEFEVISDTYVRVMPDGEHIESKILGLERRDKNVDNGLKELGKLIDYINICKDFIDLRYAAILTYENYQFIRYDEDPTKRRIIMQFIKLIRNDICTCVATSFLENIRHCLDYCEKFDNYFGAFDLKQMSKKISNYLIKISEDELVTILSDEEISELERLLSFDEETKEKFMSLVREENEAKKARSELNSRIVTSLEQPVKRTPNVTFDNLDMSLFNQDELEIVGEIREIYEDNVVGKKTYDDVELTVDARRKAYAQEKEFKNIISDIGYLLNHIYEDKDTVIEIFKLIFKEYAKAIRKKHVEDLEDLVDAVNKMITFIRRENHFSNIGYEKTKGLDEKERMIRGTYLDQARDLVSLEDNLGDLDAEVANEIVETKVLLSQKWQEKNNGGECTDNLVFCLDGVTITDEVKDEFVSTIKNLEFQKLYDLNTCSRVRNMTRLKHGQENFDEYLRKVTGRRLRFVPHLYCGTEEGRTILFKFDISDTIRKHLNLRYGLAGESECYGVYDITEVNDKNRFMYDDVKKSIVRELTEIEKLANLLSCDNPTQKQLDILDAKIDEGLTMKKEFKSLCEGSQK